MGIPSASAFAAALSSGENRPPESHSLPRTAPPQPTFKLVWMVIRETLFSCTLAAGRAHESPI